MIAGRVNARRKAEAPIAIRRAGGSAIAIQGLIDTGFTDYLSLPRELVREAGLSLEGAMCVTLADDRSAAVNWYLAEVEWGEERRIVPVLEMKGAPLIGMSLLAGQHVQIHVVDGGVVKIE